VALNPRTIVAFLTLRSNLVENNETPPQGTARLLKALEGNETVSKQIVTLSFVRKSHFIMFPERGVIPSFQFSFFYVCFLLLYFH